MEKEIRVLLKLGIFTNEKIKIKKKPEPEFQSRFGPNHFVKKIN